MKKLWAFIYFLSFFCRDLPGAWASAMGGSHEVQKPLRVFGQSRNISMQLVLKSEKDKLKFANVRTDYRDKFSRVKY